MRIRSILAPTLLAGLLGGCGGDDRPVAETAQSASIRGRAHDEFGRSVPDADVRAAGEVTYDARTGATGYFEILDVAPGDYTLTVRRGDAVLYETCLTMTERGRIDLGDLFEGAPGYCGWPVGCAGDADCDGLADALEIAGWDVTLERADMTQDTLHVTSDPRAVDTDRDGLDDAMERAAGLNPADRDSDGDLLSDYGELFAYKCNPADADSDGDACPGGAPCTPDPNLSDGLELYLSRTSPTLADTDGDGLSDFEEIVVGGTNPLVANLPELRLEVRGDPLIELEVDYTTGHSGRQHQLRGAEEASKETDLVSTQMSIENTVRIQTEAKIGTSNYPPTASAEITTDTKFHHGYFHDTSRSWERSSVQQAQEVYEAWEASTVSFDDGRLSVALKVENLSELSFSVKDMRIVAYRLEGGGRFTLIGTLLPDAEAWPEGGHVLGPGGAFTMTASLEHIGADMMRRLVRNPTAMMFEVGAYSMFQLDEWGVEETVNYAKLGEAVVQRTGVVAIDFGDGRVDRHMVATNVYRRPDGAGAGIRLGDALRDVLGVDFEATLSEDPDGAPVRYVLDRVADVSGYDLCDPRSASYDESVDCEALHPRGFWLVGGTGPDFAKGASVDFEDVRLGPGGRVSLVYLRDSDGDGVFDREEALLGTDPTRPDTDRDGLSDFAETKEGWTVAVQGLEPYPTFPDPRFADLDGDMVSDATELHAGTDPFLEDTDGDGSADNFDFDPLAPPCLDGATLGLVAWWDGSTTASFGAPDLWVGDEDGANDGQLFAVDPSTMLVPHLEDPVFQFNQQLAQCDQYIDVPDHAALDAAREYAFSVRILYDRQGATGDWATVLAKGDVEHENYALYLDPDGKLVLAHYRLLKDKCWGWLFGWVDDLCADSTRYERVTLSTDAPIEEGAWVHVTGAFSGEQMQLFVDGALVATKSTVADWSNGTKHHVSTQSLVTNDAPLRLGADFAGPITRPFHGWLDDVQVFARAVREDRAAQLATLGVCRPLP